MTPAASHSAPSGFLARRLQALRVHIQQHHGGAGAGQHFGHGQTQPTGGARHGRHLVRHSKQILEHELTL